MSRLSFYKTVKLRDSGSHEKQVSFPELSEVTDRKAAEQAAREFVENHLREHGTLPKWELLMRDPKFAAAVEAEDERVRAEAAQELCARYARERQQVAQIEEEQKKAARERFDKFLQTYPGAKDLVDVADLDKSPNEALLNLKQRFVKDSGFSYDMSPTPGEDFLKGKRSGDCGTLAKAYVTVATECYGIDGVKWDYEGKEFFVEGGGAVTGGPTGDVDNGAHWAFTNHFWVVTPAGVFDLLFLGNPLKKNWIYSTDSGEDTSTGRTITYRVFGKHKVYAANSSGGLAGRYATSLENAKRGAELADEAYAKVLEGQKKETAKAGIRSFLERVKCPPTLLEKAAEIIENTRCRKDGSVDWDDKALASMDKKVLWSEQQWQKWVSSGGQEMEEPPKSEEKEKDAEGLDEIKEMVGYIDGFPPEKVEQAAKRLLKAKPGGEVALAKWLFPEYKNFCDGSNPTNFKFNEEKWKVWMSQGGEEEDKEAQALEEIKEMVGYIDGFPEGKVEETARRLLKAKPGGEVALAKWLFPEYKNFCDGTNPTNFKFNEEKWKSWMSQG